MMEYADPVSTIVSINFWLIRRRTMRGVDGFLLLTGTEPSSTVPVILLNDGDSYVVNVLLDHNKSIYGDHDLYSNGFYRIVLVDD